MLYRSKWLAGAMAGMLAFAAQAANMSVQSEKAPIRATATPFGQILATAVYAEQVAVVAEQGAWVQVRTAAGVTGWTQRTLLTPKKIVLNAGAADVSRTASAEEQALAGKGFNSQVEGDFKGKNPTIDFKWIDRMEQFKVSESEKVNFLRQGGLQPGGAQ